MGKHIETNIDDILIMCEQVYEGGMTGKNSNQVKVDITSTAAIVRAAIQGSKYKKNVSQMYRSKKALSQQNNPLGVSSHIF